MPIPVDALKALRLKQGRRIREYRTARKLTQEQLGTTIGVSKMAVSAWEAGANAPVAPHQVAIAKALGVPWYVLFGLDDGEDVA